MSGEKEFDYGEKKEDGQFENHPTNLEGKWKAPIRDEYKHIKCGTVTRMGIDLAETYAKHPATEFYSRTFCVGCGDYFPLSEFVWLERGVETGYLMTYTGGKAGIDLTKYGTGKKYKKERR